MSREKHIDIACCPYATILGSINDHIILHNPLPSVPLLSKRSPQYLQKRESFPRPYNRGTFHLQNLQCQLPIYRPHHQVSSPRTRALTLRRSEDGMFVIEYETKN